jgi:HAD superfamily hydrolase (TIGR01456 family)
LGQNLCGSWPEMPARCIPQLLRNALGPITQLPPPAARTTGLRTDSIDRRKVVPDFAFVFDIDGVILRSAAPIKGAAQSLRYLQKQSIPFIFLTNGGGKRESARIKDLSTKLEVKLDTSMIIQSHTPFAELVHPSKLHPEGLKDKCILVCGGDKDGCRGVAHAYGFTNVVLPGDIYAAHPTISPFTGVFQNYYGSFAKPLPRPINPENPSESLKIDAIFVYSDPRDWALDIQIISDVLLSEKGIMGTYSSKNNDKSLQNHGYQQDGQPPIYFSNPDLLWAASYHLPRFGQGGFREALEGVWAAVTGGSKAGVELYKTIIGKPYRRTYEFAEKRLIEHREELFGLEAGMTDLKRVYMVGDNPESDIAGANNFKSPTGAEWVSLLTRTGVFKDRAGQRPTHEPRMIVDDVKAAVQWAVKDSSWPVLFE